MVATKKNKYISRFESAPVPYVTLTTEGTIMDVNSEAAQLLDRNQRDLINGRIEDYLQAGSKEIFREFLKDLTIQHRRNESEVVLISENGAPVSAKIHGISGSERGIPMVYLVINDITKYKEEKRVLEKAIQENKTILKEVNHRIKNNLNILTSLIHLQKFNDTDEKLKTNLNDIESRINAIKIIHDKILTPEMVDRINSNHYVTSLISELLHLFVAGEIELELDVDNIEFSSKQLVWLGIILSELVTNALKYGFKGAEEKNLSVSLKDAEGTCTLAVKNNGESIPETVDIFTTDSLGLTVVRGMVHQLEGEMFLNRQNSTEFTIIFPRIR